MFTLAEGVAYFQDGRVEICMLEVPSPRFEEPGANKDGGGYKTGVDARRRIESIRNVLEIDRR